MLDLIVFGFVAGKRVVEFVVVSLFFTSLNITTLKGLDYCVTQ